MKVRIFTLSTTRKIELRFNGVVLMILWSKLRVLDTDDVKQKGKICLVLFRGFCSFVFNLSSLCRCATNTDCRLVDRTPADQGPVVRRPISASQGLNFNPGFFFFCSKAFFPIICSIPFSVSCWVWNVVFKLVFIAGTYNIVDVINLSQALYWA